MEVKTSVKDVDISLRNRINNVFEIVRENWIQSGEVVKLTISV